MTNRFWACFVGLGIIFILLVIFIATSGEPIKKPHIQDMRVMLSMEMTDIESVQTSKSNYEYYLYGKKNKSTYKFSITKEQYEDLQDIDNEKLDILYVQGIYAEKTSVGISLSNQRR